MGDGEAPEDWRKYAPKNNPFLAMLKEKEMKVDFFKPEDFVDSVYTNAQGPQICANLANAKLEREGKIVYRPEDASEVWIDNEKDRPTHTALLINIQPIKKCEHPKEKLKLKPYCVYDPKSQLAGEWQGKYECGCGVQLEPSAFTEVK